MEFTIFGLLNFLAETLEMGLLEDLSNKRISDYELSINYDDFRIDGFVINKCKVKFSMSAIDILEGIDVIYG